MHQNAIDLFKHFYDNNIKDKTGLKILEIGSLRVTGQSCIRDLFDFSNHYYCGVDITKGENVDIVSTEKYSYPIADGMFDIVIALNVLEHVEDLHSFIAEMSRVSRNLLYVSVPFRWKQHRYPVDCWRIYPDGLKFLFEQKAGCEVVAIGTSGYDTYGIAKKITNNK